MNKHLFKAFSLITILALMLAALPMQSALADNTVQSLPFSQNWSNAGLITTSDDWSGVPGIIGYRGDGLTGATGVDPQTVVADGTGVPDVNANQTNPNTFTTGGVAEFDTLADKVVALQGSGTARAPFLLLHLKTTGLSGITVAYNLRDVDGSADNAIQPVALQYRVGSSGNFTNLPAGFVADASTGPNLATLVTPVSVVLPATADNQPLIQVRVITTDAVGSDEWIGVDDINVTGTVIPIDPAPFVDTTTPANSAANVLVDSNIEVKFSEAVNVSGNWFQIVCPTSGTRNVADTVVTGGPTIFTIDPNVDFANSETCTVTIYASQVTDQDTDDPPDNMASDYSWSFDTVGAPGAAVFFNEIHYDNTGGDVGEAIEIAGPTCTDLTGWSVVLYNGTGGAVYNTTTLSGPIPNLGGGFGVVVVNYPSNGIQNGSPDGMALVDNTNNVIQFLSYEGTFTAVGGPANGMASVDVGVSENGTGAVGASLQLTGSGATYNNFAWASDAPNTFGAFNTGQTFTGGGQTNPCGVGAANPGTVFAGNSALLTVSAIPGTNPASTGLAVIADLSSVGGSPTQVFYDDGTNGDQFIGDGVFSYLATVALSTSPGVLSLPATITDAESRTGSASINLTVRPPLSAIHDIQGASHISPLAGQLVSTEGVVTVKASNGFYIEEPAANWDVNTSTSEGIFVFTSSAPSVNVGDSVLVLGTPTEFRPGGVSNGNLTTTEISNPGRSVEVLSSGNPLPATVVIGTGGRMPPTENIEDDATGDVENSGVFDPVNDGIDFYESMEGMLVQVNNPLAVGPTNAFGETPIVPDNGTWAGVRTARGGILLRPNDGNPERLVLDDIFVSVPAMNVGDYLNGAVVGALDYNFGNFFLEVTSNPLPSLVSGGLTQEATTPAGANQLSVATFNVENLAPTDPPAKYATLAELIVNHLQAPDVIAIEEIQDNNGVTDNGTVDASTTWSLLISAISTAGGPTYQYRQIDPVNDQDGGAPGGNIRQGFLFRVDRGLSFIDRPGAGSTTANAVVGSGAGTQLQYSPGRIDPTNSAFSTSRKPLAGEFMFNGHHLFVIANHFNSKGGDDPLFGHFQPPTRISEVQRHQQSQVEHDFINAIVTADPNADVVVLGDLNDFEFSDTVTILKGSPSILNDLMDTLPQNQRYSYVFEGNSQTLDHTLFSNDLFNTRPFDYDVVHVNSEFANQASDHEPQVSHITLNNPPTASAGGPYLVNESGSVILSASGSDLENDLASIPLTFDWDLDNNGSFETPGQSVTFSDTLIAPSLHTIKVRVTDNGGLTAVAQTTVAVIASRIFYLHGTGPANNPPTLFLDNTAPTATTEKYRDSASIKFSGGDLWKEVGSWSSAPALAPGTLIDLSNFHTWLGLKNSDDQGTNFDLRIEVYKNGTLAAAGESYCITGVTRNPSLAKEVILSFGSFPPAAFNGTTDVLSLKVLTRIGTNGSGGFCGGHSNAVGLRLYFDAVSRPSRFDVKFAP